MTMADFPRIEIVIGGKRIGPEGRPTRLVSNPATGETLGQMPSITPEELEFSVQAAEAAFHLWKARSALDRGGILRRSLAQE
jgi:succinate-semialdehyde dehydrogenase / glutarate-semialdehyde dehydrogenase